MDPRHFDSDPDPGFQIKAQNLEKVLKLAHIPFMRIRSAYDFDADPDTDPNPTFQFDADSCGSGSTTLVCIIPEQSAEKVLSDSAQFDRQPIRYIQYSTPDSSHRQL